MGSEIQLCPTGSGPAAQDWAGSHQHKVLVVWATSSQPLVESQLLEQASAGPLTLLRVKGLPLCMLSCFREAHAGQLGSAGM